MVVLGLLLIVLAVLALSLVVVGGANDPAVLLLGNIKWDTSAATMFVAGVVTLAVFAAGLALLQAGVRRARRRHKEAKHLDRLAAQLEQREKSQEKPAPGSEAEPSTTPETPRSHRTDEG
jgi:membrane protein implicated in regulation of membrane protease activity